MASGLYNPRVAVRKLCGGWIADLRVQVRERARLRRDAEAVRRPHGVLHRVRRAGQKGPAPGEHLVQGVGLLLYRLQGWELVESRARQERREDHEGRKFREQRLFDRESRR